MIAKNKWTAKLYTVFSESVKTFELQRADGSEFEIQKSEFYFNYRVVDEDEDEDKDNRKVLIKQEVSYGRNNT